jgi:hypothetical protein
MPVKVQLRVWKKLTQVRQLLLFTIAAYAFLAYSVFAQTPESQTTQESNKSWTSTTGSQDNNLTPTRIIETHSQKGDQTLDTRSVQIRGSGGHFEPYQDVEKETLQINASTIRTTTRTFGRDANGMKTLVQVTEEERHTSDAGDSNVLRITYNADLNGTLQTVQREIVETKKIGADLEQTKATVMLPSTNGGLAPVLKTDETRKLGANGTVESKKTTLLADGAGNWQLSEIRQTTTRQEANNRSTEERIFRRQGEEGKLAEVSHVVSKDLESSSGEKRNVVETYSVDLPGATQDGNLHLVERTTISQGSTPTGEKIMQKEVEQPNAGDRNSGLRISVLMNDKMQPGPSGEQDTETIRMRDYNGNFGVVSVDMTKSDKVPTIQVQQTP